jgi:hypothetical protein
MEPGTVLRASATCGTPDQPALLGCQLNLSTKALEDFAEAGESSLGGSLSDVSISWRISFILARILRFIDSVSVHCSTAAAVSTHKTTSRGQSCIWPPRELECVVCGPPEIGLARPRACAGEIVGLNGFVRVRVERPHSIVLELGLSGAVIAKSSAPTALVLLRYQVPDSLRSSC